MLSDAEKRARFEKSLLYGGGTHSIEDVAQLVREHRAQYWPNADGTIITELNTFPKFKTVHYWIITGVLPDCLALDATISEWARAEGCAFATASGRKGWGRVAAPYGWKPHMQTFIKDLRQ